MKKKKKKKKKKKRKYGKDWLLNGYQKSAFFFKEDTLNFTMKINFRIKKCIYKLINTKKNHLTSAKTKYSSTNFVCKCFGT